MKADIENRVQMVLATNQTRMIDNINELMVKGNTLSTNVTTLANDVRDLKNSQQTQAQKAYQMRIYDAPSHQQSWPALNVLIAETGLASFGNAFGPMFSFGAMPRKEAPFGDEGKHRVKTPGDVVRKGGTARHPFNPHCRLSTLARCANACRLSS